jgi:general nucleoside transport system permease protein
LLMPTMPVLSVQIAMALAGMAAGGLLIALVGFLRHWRGVNEVISSLLITYIALAIFNFLVEGPMRDPASLNKPSTYPIGKEFMLGNMFGLDIHWGLAFGVVYCIVMWVLLDHTTFGFAARMVGGNVRSAQASGLPVGRLILICCFLAGGAAGLAGMVEIAAVHRQANASLNAMYGFTGILVSFIARHHPLGVMPAAVLFGGLSAASGLLQRRMGLPDASMGVFMGTIFVLILMFETFYGRIGLFQPKYKEPVVVEVPPRLAPRPAEEVVAK